MAPSPQATLFGFPLKFVALGALVVQTSSAVLLTRYSRNVHSGEQYYSTTLVVMAEFTKLAISLLLVFLIDSNPAGAKGNWGTSRWTIFCNSIQMENFLTPLDTLKLAIPAGLYTLQNNLVYVALSNLEATTFQVGYQMKVITTAVLSVLMLNRKLSSMKWTALFLLTFGIVMTQMDSSKGKAVDKTEREQNFYVGIISVLTCGFSSALAGVYFEKILKGSNPSVWMRNSQLAFFSTILGLSGMLYADGWIFKDFFKGYTALVWCIILIQAAGGLIVAMVVKYADNILKGFATAISIIVCGVVSSQFFGFQPTTLFIMGSSVVIGATMLYSMPDRPAAVKDAPTSSPTSPNVSKSPGDVAVTVKHRAENV